MYIPPFQIGNVQTCKALIEHVEHYSRLKGKSNRAAFVRIQETEFLELMIFGLFWSSCPILMGSQWQFHAFIISAKITANGHEGHGLPQNTYKGTHFPPN